MGIEGHRSKIGVVDQRSIQASKIKNHWLGDQKSNERLKIRVMDERLIGISEIEKVKMEN